MNPSHFVLKVLGWIILVIGAYAVFIAVLDMLQLATTDPPPDMDKGLLTFVVGVGFIALGGFALSLSSRRKR